MSDVLNSNGELLIKAAFLINCKEINLSRNTVYNWKKRGKQHEYRNGDLFFYYSSLPDPTKQSLCNCGYTEKDLEAIQVADEHHSNAIRETNDTHKLAQLIESDFNSRLRSSRYFEISQYYQEKMQKGHRNKTVIRYTKQALVYLALNDLKNKGYSFKQLLSSYRLIIDKMPKIPLSRERFSEKMKSVGHYQNLNDFLYSIIDGVLKTRLNPTKIGRPSDVQEENSLIPNTLINVNEFHAKTLIALYTLSGLHNKLDFEQTFLRYTSICKKEGVEPVHISTVKKFLNRKEIKYWCINKERDGKKGSDTHDRQLSGKKPDYSLSKGGYDGFQVDFRTKIGNKQVMLTVVAVFDYRSEAITGYDVGLVEDGLMVRNMYRNHLNTTGGRSYIEIESDRFSGNLTSDTRSIFEQCCKYITQPAPNDPIYAKAPNPKARYVERLIQEFNRLTQSFPGWKGTNFYTKDASRRPNEDRAAGTAVPTIEEGIQQIIKLVNIYNNQPIKKFNGQSRMQVFNQSINPDALEIPVWKRAMILNQHTITTVRNGVIEITVNRRKYEYVFEDFQDKISFLLKGDKVKVYYDETTMETVDIFGKDELHLGTLKPLIRVNRAKAEQTEQDKINFGRQIGRAKKERNNRDRKTLELLASIYEVDISGKSIREAAEIIRGLGDQNRKKLLNNDEFYSKELECEEAVAATNYYENRLLRAQGLQVPVPVISNEQKRREFYKHKKSYSSNFEPNAPQEHRKKSRYKRKK